MTRLNEEETFVPIVEQRLLAVNKMGSEILKLSQIDSSSCERIVQFYITKCLLSLSKSLLSQKVKQRVQEKMADDIA